MIQLIPILKVVGGPALVWCLRRFAPSLVAKFPAWAQPITASVVNVITAVASGTDPVASVTTLVEAVTTAVTTLGTVKAIDLATGNANVVTAGEKAKLDEMNV